MVGGGEAAGAMKGFAPGSVAEVRQDIAEVELRGHVPLLVGLEKPRHRMAGAGFGAEAVQIAHAE